MVLPHLRSIVNVRVGVTNHPPVVKLSHLSMCPGHFNILTATQAHQDNTYVYIHYRLTLHCLQVALCPLNVSFCTTALLLQVKFNSTVYIKYLYNFDYVYV